MSSATARKTTPYKQYKRIDFKHPSNLIFQHSHISKTDFPFSNAHHVILRTILTESKDIQIPATWLAKTFRDQAHTKPATKRRWWAVHETLGTVLNSWKIHNKTVYDKMRLGLWTCNEIPCKTCWHYDIKKKATYEMLRCRESIKLLHQSNGIDTPHWRPFDAMEERLFAKELHFHSTWSLAQCHMAAITGYYLKYPWKVYTSNILERCIYPTSKETCEATHVFVLKPKTACMWSSFLAMVSLLANGPFSGGSSIQVISWVGDACGDCPLGPQ